MERSQLDVLRGNIAPDKVSIYVNNSNSFFQEISILKFLVSAIYARIIHAKMTLHADLCLIVITNASVFPVFTGKIAILLLTRVTETLVPTTHSAKSLRPADSRTY